MADPSRIDYLIAGYLSNKLSPEESAELQLLISQSEKNKAFFDQYVHSGKYLKDIEFMLTSPHERMNRKFYKMLDEHYPNDKRLSPIRPIWSWKRIRVYAAIVIPILLIVAAIFLKKTDPSRESTSAIASHGNDTTADATLTINNTSKTNLDSIPKDNHLLAKTWVFRKPETNYYIYTPGAEAEKDKITGNRPPDYHEITLSKNTSPIEVTLPNEIRVKIKPGTRFRYPVWDPGTPPQQMICYLDGEVNIEMPPDKSIPFVIIGSRSKTVVLGTGFRIHDYKKEDSAVLDLVHGKVKLSDSSGERATIIKPGQEASIKGTDRPINIRYIPSILTLQLFEAKHQLGFFSFGDDNLKQILKKISDWYGLDAAVYQGNIDTTTIGQFGPGTIPQDGLYFSDLQEKLQHKFHYDFKKTNNQIMVSEKTP